MHVQRDLNLSSGDLKALHDSHVYNEGTRRSLSYIRYGSVHGRLQRRTSGLQQAAASSGVYVRRRPEQHLGRSDTSSLESVSSPHRQCASVGHVSDSRGSMQ
jgi:hypothetical protein